MNARTGRSFSRAIIASREQLERVFSPAVQALLVELLGDWSTPAPHARLVSRFHARAPVDTQIEVKDKESAVMAAQYSFALTTDHPDYPALDLLNSILGSGESSRLNKSLVREAKVALGQQTYLNAFGPRRGPGQFLALVIANQGVTPDTLEKRLAAEIEAVARTGVTPEELTRAKNQFRAAKVNERQQTFAMGEAVQNATFFLGSPDAVNSDLDRYAKVTVDDVKRVAATYLIPANSLVVTVLPEAK